MNSDNIRKLIEQFLFHCNYEKNLSKKTLAAYQTDLEQFIAYIKSENINKVDKEIIKCYFRHISGLKPKTIKRKIATVKALFNFLEFEDEISENPFRKIKVQIKEAKELPTVMTLSEIKQVFKIVYAELKDKEEGSFSYKEKLRDVAVLELLFATGIRVSELVTLQPQNIDLKSNYIIVNGKGNKERVIQLANKEALSALKNYFKVFACKIYESGYFFVNRLNSRLSAQSVRFMIKKYATEAKILKNITPHTFRHTFATLLLEQDVDIKYIQHLLGHSSIITTQIYTHVNKKQQQKILKTKHPRKLFSSNDF